MKKNIILLILVSSLFSSDYIYEYEEETSDTQEHEEYQCDGREYCSQMTSCEEATFFINNCPNTKMDGDNDGIPCERQFCH